MARANLRGSGVEDGEAAEVLRDDEMRGRWVGVDAAGIGRDGITIWDDSGTGGSEGSGVLGNGMAVGLYGADLVAVEVDGVENFGVRIAVDEAEGSFNRGVDKVVIIIRVILDGLV